METQPIIERGELIAAEGPLVERRAEIRAHAGGEIQWTAPGTNPRINRSINNMSAISRYLGAGAIIAASSLGATVASADNGDSGRHRDAYAVTPLVSDIAGAAALEPAFRN